MGGYDSTAEAGMPPYGWAIPGGSGSDGIADMIDFALVGQDWFVENEGFMFLTDLVYSEPAMLLLLGMGAVMLRRRRHQFLGGDEEMQSVRPIPRNFTSRLRCQILTTSSKG